MKEELESIKSEIDYIKEKIEHNYANISKNREDIDHNTGAVALLHTLNSNSNKYFIIWLLTFMLFLGSFGYIIYLKTEYSKTDIIETSEIDQSNDSGDNNYIGRDGDINGYSED